MKVYRLANAPHTLEGARLWYFEGGLIEIKSSCQSRLASRGTVVYIPPKFTCTVKALNSFASGWMMTLPNVEPKKMPKELTIFDSSDLMTAICVRLGELSASELNSAICRHLESILIHEIETSRLPVHAEIPIPQSPSLSAVAFKIREEPDDMESIDYWAAEAAMSRRTFTQKFKEETGMTFATWRQKVKLIAALDILASGKTVTETALKLGYRNASTFNTLFRKQFGLPPRKYLRSIDEDLNE